MKKILIGASLLVLIATATGITYAYAANENNRDTIHIEQRQEHAVLQDDVKASLEELNQLSDEVWEEVDELKSKGNQEEADALLAEWREAKGEMGKHLLEGTEKVKGQEVSKKIKDNINKFKKEHVKEK